MNDFDPKLATRMTGNRKADELILSVLNDMGRSWVKGRRVHNCIGGDIVRLTCKKSGVVSWGVVVKPQFISFIRAENDQRENNKLCSLKTEFKVSFWR